MSYFPIAGYLPRGLLAFSGIFFVTFVKECNMCRTLKQVVGDLQNQWTNTPIISHYQILSISIVNQWISVKAIETCPKEKCHPHRPHLCSANARNHLPCSLSVRPGTVLLLNVKAAPVHLMRKSMEIWSIDQLFLHLIGHLIRICWECYDIMSWKQLVNCRAKKRRPLHHPHHLRHPRTFLNLGGSRSSLAETLEMPSDALLFAKPSIIDRCSANKKNESLEWVPWRQNDQSIGLINWTHSHLLLVGSRKPAVVPRGTRFPWLSMWMFVACATVWHTTQPAWPLANFGDLKTCWGNEDEDSVKYATSHGVQHSPTIDYFVLEATVLKK